MTGGGRTGLTCGIDVGGTKILGGVVDEDGTIVEELRVESPATDTEAIETAIEKLVMELRGRHDITAIGIGAAGYIDKARSTVLFAPNIAWRDVNLKADLEARVEVPVVVYGRLKSGEPVHMKGPVTLRRVNDVPGSTAEQRRWHISQSGIRPRPK